MRFAVDSYLTFAVTSLAPQLLDRTGIGIEVAGQLLVTAGDNPQRQSQYLVDGTLLPCWSWASHPELYSGKHKTTGMNIQVACTLAGDIAWISDPIAGSRHDTYCLNESGILLTRDPGNWVGDKGYVGNGMITPIKKPAHRDLLDWEKEFNAQINKIRWIIEQVIANLKTWRILHTDYRRPINTSPPRSRPLSRSTSGVTRE